MATWTELWNSGQSALYDPDGRRVARGYRNHENVDALFLKTVLAAHGDRLVVRTEVTLPESIPPAADRLPEMAPFIRWSDGFIAQEGGSCCFVWAVANCALYLRPGQTLPDLRRACELAGCECGAALHKGVVIDYFKVPLTPTDDPELVLKHGGVLNILHPTYNGHSFFLVPHATDPDAVLAYNSWLGPTVATLGKGQLRKFPARMLGPHYMFTAQFGYDLEDTVLEVPREPKDIQFTWPAEYTPLTETNERLPAFTESEEAQRRMVEGLGVPAELYRDAAQKPAGDATSQAAGQTVTRLYELGSPKTYFVGPHGEPLEDEAVVATGQQPDGGENGEPSIVVEEKSATPPAASALYADVTDPQTGETVRIMPDGSQRPVASQEVVRLYYEMDINCHGCGRRLEVKNVWMHDGCPCNSPVGCNDDSPYFRALRAAFDLGYSRACYTGEVPVDVEAALYEIVGLFDCGDNPQLPEIEETNTKLRTILTQLVGQTTAGKKAMEKLPPPEPPAVTPQDLAEARKALMTHADHILAQPPGETIGQLIQRTYAEARKHGMNEDLATQLATALGVARRLIDRLGEPATPPPDPQSLALTPQEREDWKATGKLPEWFDPQRHTICDCCGVAIGHTERLAKADFS